MPSSTGNVSRMRPVRRASTIARAGSPRRAGRVADISTPIIVAEVDVAAAQRARSAAPRGRSSTRSWRAGTSTRIISAVATSTQVASERTMLVDHVVDADPLRGDEGEPDAEQRRRRRAPIRRAVRWRPPARAGAGSSEGRRRAGHRRRAVGGHEAEPAGERARARVAGSGDRDARARRRPRPARRPAARRSAAADSRAAAPIAREALAGRWLSACSSSARRCGSAGGTRTPSTPSLTTSA